MPETWIDAYQPGSLIHRALARAREAHGGSLRESGDPYITHCLAVARTVHHFHLDEASVAAALLHDVVEDTKVTLGSLTEEFGSEIASLVEGLTKLKAVPYPAGDLKVENLRKFILSFSKDLRVLIVKLADRLHNMQTLSALPKERQEKLAWETTEIYAPLAYRLGMQQLSGELEDLAFPYLHPEEYRWLRRAIAGEFEARQVYAERLKPIITKLLGSFGIHPIAINARAKRYSSLYKKLQRYAMDLEKIHDLVAVRIIVPTVEECYATLGALHQQWPPLPGQFDDYIARPKPNGYRSLHTTVFCVNHEITEFQVRTQEMHEADELGIAAHWAYQQVKSSAGAAKRWAGVTNRSELQWVEQLRRWQQTFQSNRDFMDALQQDFFKDRIYVLTPANNVVDLPAGATPVDFAYRIHTDIGDQCVGARVNGQIAPLDRELRSGDMVEIITQRGKKPSEDWLRFVKTAQAKQHIKGSLRSRKRPLEKRSLASFLEIKIVNHDRPGYLREVTTVFAESRINITYVAGAADHRRRYSTVTLRCEPLLPAKLGRLLVALKRLPGTKEVHHRMGS